MDQTATPDTSLFERLTDWRNLLTAARKARRGKRQQPEVARFEFAREHELLRIQEELRTHGYRPGAWLMQRLPQAGADIRPRPAAERA